MAPTASNMGNRPPSPPVPDTVTVPNYTTNEDNYTNNEDNQNSSSSPKFKKVWRCWFPVGAKIDDRYVQQVMGTCTIGMSPEEIQKMVRQLKQDRDDARSWGKHKVESRVLSAFREFDDSVQTMDQLRRRWRDNGNAEFAGALWMALYGAFDRSPGWAKELKEEYMKVAGFIYRRDEGNQKEREGCFQRLFAQVKVDLVKRLNGVGKAAHGGTIRLKRTLEEVSKETRFLKRPKGKTMTKFYSKLEDGGNAKTFDPMTIAKVKLESTPKKQSPKKKSPKKKSPMQKSPTRKSPRQKSPTQKSPPTPTFDSTQKKARHNKQDSDDDDVAKVWMVSKWLCLNFFIRF